MVCAFAGEAKHKSPETNSARIELSAEKEFNMWKTMESFPAAPSGKINTRKVKGEIEWKSNYIRIVASDNDR